MAEDIYEFAFVIMLVVPYMSPKITPAEWMRLSAAVVAYCNIKPAFLENW